MDTSTDPAGGWRLWPRDPHEPHRVAAPLELFLDLVSVIAIAAAAEGLHHAIVEAHVAEGVLGFVMGFFAIYWAWVNYTWFASAYGNDGPLFRILTIVFMAGSLMTAAGIREFFGGFELTMLIGGYVVMRIVMVLLWLIAAGVDHERRRTCLTYAIGVALVQAYWVAVLFMDVPTETFPVPFLAGVLLEIAVPVLAERQGRTTWHRHHITERYGLLNIIVLGEVLLAGSLALGHLGDGEAPAGLLRIIFGALVIVFAMFWLYFGREDHLPSDDLAFLWGYGHFVIYAAGAAVGAGFAALVDIVTHHAEVGPLTGKLAVAVPVALYMAGLWLVRDRFVIDGAGRSVLLVAGGLAILAAFLPFAVEAIAVIAVAAVLARRVLAHPRA